MLVSFLARNPGRLLSAVARAPMSSSQAAPAAKEAVSVSVEYAKSGRSTCKGCSLRITNGVVRLGASTRDPRGYDSIKWYHVTCFPASSHPLGPVEKVKGSDSIKDDDLQELRELEKNNKRDATAVGPLDEPSSKKVKTHQSSSAEGVSEKASISVEYAKSARSTCKGCSENIAKGALRLGAFVHDPRGYDSTKWYHIACFPASSYPIFHVEDVKGFDSIEISDREELSKLEVNNTGLSNEGEEKNLEEVKNNKRDATSAGLFEESRLKKVKTHQSSAAEVVSEKASISVSEKEGAEENLEEVKLSTGYKKIGPSITFSVSDIKKTYKDATLPAHWKVFDTVIFREQDDGLQASAKIAAFDFDGCLAKTSVRSIGADKWSLQHKSIPKKLQRLHNNGYKLVIFTNESNIERWKNKRQQAVDSKVGRLDNFINCVKAPIQVFIACGLGKGKGTPDDQFRKPNTGMWWLMAEHFNSGVAIDMDQSFYVGDAAGRENDHSDADKEFAKDIGLKFYVPEEYFVS